MSTSTVKLFNTMSRSVEIFEPLQPQKVRLYTCGLTVYSQPHIGNWTAYIYWDVLVRVLEASGFDVERVQNITDVGHLVSDNDDGEDKLEKGARLEGTSAWEVAAKYAAIADNEAYTLLKLRRPTHMPKATDYIPQQIQFVKDLELKGFTYVIADGVYFDTSKLTDYGKLARLDIEGLQTGARIADVGKKNPTDFALWKLSPQGQKRDMEWDSPWGVGFPGWHLECSVMAQQLLGEQIDIHTGGIDHIPVHHTNEIAQSESHNGNEFARFWLHNNHLKINGTKVSKSLGNIITLQDIVDKGYSLQAFKLMILSKHYHTEGNFTWEILESFQNRLNNWGATADLRWQLPAESPESTSPSPLISILQNNLDTPQALAHIDEVLNSVSEHRNASSLNQLVTLIEAIHLVLGIKIGSEDLSGEEKTLISERETARSNKDWATADALREQLLQQGINLSDHGSTVYWSRTKYTD